MQRGVSGQVRFTHTKIAQITINYSGTAKSSLSLSHSHKAPDLEWRRERNVCQLVGKEVVWNLVSSSVNVELCCRAWNLMSPLVISSTRNETTSTTQRSRLDFCNNQLRERNNENFRAIILTGVHPQLISFYHYRGGGSMYAPCKTMSAAEMKYHWT